MKTITLGDRIRDARGTMTQDQLADRIRARRPGAKINGVRISKYERNVQSPRLGALVAIAEATGKPLDFFRVEESSDGDGAGLDGDADEDDSHAMMRAAYHLDRTGEYAMADQLRSRARRAAMRAVRA